MAGINVLRASVHLISFLVMALGTWTDTQVIQFGWDSYAGKWKYLTFWDLWLQTIYFGMCLSSDIIDSSTSSSTSSSSSSTSSSLKKDPNPNPNPNPNPPTTTVASSPSRTEGLKTLQRLIDQAHAMFVFPIGMFVVVTFWAIYFFDRELIFPSYLDDIIPSWLNHIMHSFPLLFLFMDKWIVHHRYPSKKRGLLGVLFFTSIYTFWILFLAFRKGIWVYPVLEILQFNQRFCFIGLLWMFVVSIYILGDSLTTFLWRKQNRFAASTPPVAKKSKKLS